MAPTKEKTGFPTARGTIVAGRCTACGCLELIDPAWLHVPDFTSSCENCFAESIKIEVLELQVPETDELTTYKIMSNQPKSNTTGFAAADPAGWPEPPKGHHWEARGRGWKSKGDIAGYAYREDDPEDDWTQLDGGATSGDPQFFYLELVADNLQGTPALDAEYFYSWPPPPAGFHWEWRGKGWKTDALRYGYAFHTNGQWHVERTGLPGGRDAHSYLEAVPNPQTTAPGAKTVRNILANELGLSRQQVTEIIHQRVDKLMKDLGLS